MKRAVWGGVIVGSLLGGWIPTLFGADSISMATVVGSTVGSVVCAIAVWSVARQYR